MKKPPKTPPYIRGYIRGFKKKQKEFAESSLVVRILKALTGKL